MEVASISSISVSSDCTSLAIACDHSCYAFSMDPVKRLFHKKFVNYRLTHIATVSKGSAIAISCVPLEGDVSVNKVFLWDNAYGECSAQLGFNEEIVNLVLKPEYLLIILSKSICLYDIKNQVSHLQMKTALNTKGAGDLFIKGVYSVMAICGQKDGELALAEGTSVTKSVVAHQHPLSVVSFSPDGSMIATVSTNGTLIRLFDHELRHLCVYRRGTFPQDVLSLCISEDGGALAAVSASGTVHLFNAQSRSAEGAEGERSLAKAKLEKQTIASTAFKAPGELRVALGSGHMLSFRCTAPDLTVVDRVFVLAN